MKLLGMTLAVLSGVLGAWSAWRLRGESWSDENPPDPHDLSRALLKAWGALFCAWSAMTILDLFH